MKAFCLLLFLAPAFGGEVDWLPGFWTGNYSIGDYLIEYEIRYDDEHAFEIRGVSIFIFKPWPHYLNGKGRASIKKDSIYHDYESFLRMNSNTGQIVRPKSVPHQFSVPKKFILNKKDPVQMVQIFQNEIGVLDTILFTKKPDNSSFTYPVIVGTPSVIKKERARKKLKHVNGKSERRFNLNGRIINQ